MCDTMVATPESTAQGVMLFAKNSDREPNEAQALERIPAGRPDSSELQVTYIKVPQVSETYEVLLARPFQMWGAEMGANQHGLTIGNEALFTRIKFKRDNSGLTGMDMLRLALERCQSARDAFDLIGELIEQYGQDACGGYTDQKFYYHNSFILCDAREAYVLESAGEHWAGLRVKGFRSISNGLTIGSAYDFASKNLEDHARKQGWLKRNRDFNFRECYSDRLMTHFSHAHFRQSCSMRLGQSAAGQLDVAGMLRILRSHGEGDHKNLQAFHPAEQGMQSLCLHASGMTAPSQTTGSLVAELPGDGKPATFWATGTAAPCLSVFKPIYIPGSNLVEDQRMRPGARPDGSLWWQHEVLHRAALVDYPAVAAIVRPLQQELEQDFQTKDRYYKEHKARPAELDAFSAECFERAQNALLQALDQLPSPLRGRGLHPFYRRYWRGINRSVGISV